LFVLILRLLDLRFGDGDCLFPRTGLSLGQQRLAGRQGILRLPNGKGQIYGVQGGDQLPGLDFATDLDMVGQYRATGEKAELELPRWQDRAQGSHPPSGHDSGLVT
jgi:hypothetical protein